MGDQQASPHSDGRAAGANAASPALTSAAGGIDWSIFKDGEDDAFNWLLRSNAQAAGLTLPSGDPSDIAGEILPLDDFAMAGDDSLMGLDGAGVASPPRRQREAVASAVAAAVAAGAAAGRSRTASSSVSAQALAARIYSGLRPSRRSSGASTSTGKPQPQQERRSSLDGDISIDDSDFDMEDGDDDDDMEAFDDGSPGRAKQAGKKTGNAASRKTTKSKGSTPKSKRPAKRKKAVVDDSDEDEDDKDGDVDKKQLRREKNLVSVREFRKRKMKQLEQNEARLRRLEAENMDLKMQLKIGKEAIVSEQREKQQIKEKMRELLKRGASEQEIAQFLNMYKVTYSDYGPKRREKLHFHLDRIRELLLPTQVTKLSLYSVEQGMDMMARDTVIRDDPMAVPDSAAATMSLWGILAKELEVSDAQQRQILERRAAIKQVRDNLNDTLSIVKQLEDVTNDKNSALEAQVAELQEILTPSQATKFIIWVKENPAFMYMLDKLVDSTLMTSK